MGQLAGGRPTWVGKAGSMPNRQAISKGFLTRLVRNEAGNTLAMTAAGIIPLLGLIGGGVDMSRIYLTKSRLQQACDAGALAGRKMMGGGSWSANNNKAQTTANAMFDANFQSGDYGTTGLTRSFAENAGKVTGTASVTVPMSIMKIFGNETKLLDIVCDAEMRIPNTDVMFVLDVTGSMAQTNSGDTAPKIDGLKNAVKCFYEALAKLDTNADCGSTPSGGNSSSVQLRFGFVPYASNVNVGRLLHNDWIADNWTYQSREARFATEYYVTSYGAESAASYGTTTSTTPSYPGSWDSFTSDVRVGTTTYTYRFTRITETDCNAKSVPAAVDSMGTSTTSQTSWPGTPTYPQSTVTNGYTTSQTNVRTYYRYRWTSRDGNNRPGICVLQFGTSDWTRTTPSTTTQAVNWASRPVFDYWTYQPQQWPVSTLKAGGSSWRNSVTLPVGSGGANTTVDWDGCIEERKTVRATSFSPIPADAYDLDIDRIPSTSDPDTQWGPMLPNAIWGRYNSYGNNSYSAVDSSSNLSRNYTYSCPTASRKLTIYSTATPFQNYVDSLTASGNTYHDIGLIWGARLISPTGLFASENAFTPQGGQIERHIIFMTDGDTQTGNENYTAYGVPWWDRRQTSTGSAPSSSTLDTQVNLRFQAMCSAIKNKNITLWVISFGSGVSSTAQTALQNCASSGRFYSASNSATLINQFRQIASEISQLRLTR